MNPNAQGGPGFKGLTRPATVLFAEDSRTQAAQLQHHLESNGYHVVAASDGNSALEAARRQIPDLVISDIDMPFLDGYEMCRALKQDHRLCDIPVILLTSLGNLEDVVRGLEAGADYYITKPYQSDYLLSRVKEILTDPRPEKSLAPENPISFFLKGKAYTLTANRRQILTLLLSTYSDAVQRNKELIESQEQLNRQNQLLDEAIRSERQAHDVLKDTQSQLMQSEKMAGLGQLVAGIAHEINNPLAFVSNNVAVLQRDLSFLRQILELYKQAECALTQPADSLDAIHKLEKQIDLPYTLKNLEETLSRSSDGLRRIQQIVTDLRTFVRLDDSSLKEADLNAGIESTVNIIRSKAKGQHVRIEMDLHPLPPVSCYPAKINQVVMNLVANAIDASPPDKTVTVRTGACDDGVRIEVVDQGTGIAPALRNKIFDPFFTTKPPGKGTGLGLSISYGIIRDHGGRIEIQSEQGAGSRFIVYIPLSPKDARAKQDSEEVA
jgi:signal transduction histidine kinase